MRFITITLIVHAPDPFTGAQKSTRDRFQEALDSARLAEELGFDGFGVGERHERPFISSSPTVVLSHIAALTKRIRLFTAVTTLSLLDPVRAFEDYATLDQLSGGRLELIIGKGNGAAQRDLFNVTPDDQWDRNAESYEVFRRLWQDNKITYDTQFRPPLHEAEVWPRPLQRPIRIWHGSATSEASVDLAARYGDPLFSANVTNPIDPYAALIRYYRDRWAHYGHDPAAIAVGAGTAGYYSARNSQDAIAAYRPVFAGHLAFSEAPRRPAGLPHPGGFHRALLGPDRQPGPGHREGPPLLRAVRPQRAAPARGRRRPDRRAAPGQPGVVPVRHRPGTAPRDPRPALGLGRRAARRRHRARLGNVPAGARGGGRLPRRLPGRHHRLTRFLEGTRMTNTPLAVLHLVPLPARSPTSSSSCATPPRPTS